MSYRFAFAALALGAVAFSPAAAQDGGEPISRASFITTMDANFAALDGNGDGQVTAQEAMEAQRRATYDEALRQNQQIFGQLDRDGDGMLTAQEFSGLVNPQSIPADPAPLLQQFDVNGDGTITLVEYRTRTQANFDAIDTDRDGVVTPMEMQAAGIVPK